MKMKYIYIYICIHYENKNWIYRFSNLLLTGISFGSISPSHWVSLVVKLLPDMKASQNRQPLKNGEKFIPLNRLVEPLIIVIIPTVVLVVVLIYKIICE